MARARQTPPMELAHPYTAFLVGVASLMDLSGRTAYLYFRELRREHQLPDVSFDSGLMASEVVKRGQWVGFVFSIAVILAAGVLVAMDHTALAVTLLVVKTAILTTVSLRMGRELAYCHD